MASIQASVAAYQTAGGGEAGAAAAAAAATTTTTSPAKSPSPLITPETSENEAKPALLPTPPIPPSAGYSPAVGVKPLMGNAPMMPPTPQPSEDTKVSAAAVAASASANVAAASASAMLAAAKAAASAISAAHQGGKPVAQIAPLIVKEDKEGIVHLQGELWQRCYLSFMHPRISVCIYMWVRPSVRVNRSVTPLTKSSG